MQSLQSYEGHPTWWDRHPIVTGLTRFLLVLVGIAPILAGGIYGEYLAYASSVNPQYHITPFNQWWVVAYTIGMFVWGYFPINLAVSFNA